MATCRVKSAWLWTGADRGGQSSRCRFQLDELHLLGRTAAPMPPEAGLTQGSLAGVRAEVIVPDTARFEVQGQYSGSDAASVRGRFGMLVREIPAVSFGHHVLDLAELDHGITERLALSDSPDAAVRLTIADTGLSRRTSTGQHFRQSVRSRLRTPR